MAKEYAKGFYRSKAWRDCRDGFIASVNGLCQRCLIKGNYTPGYILHHKKPITPENISDPMITLNWKNLEYLCQECHNITHYGTGATREELKFNEYGELVER